MNVKDKFRFVRKNMKKNKTRVFMTVLATAMGCAFLIVLASVGFGLQKSIIDRMLENRKVTDITVYPKTENDEIPPRINDDDLGNLKSIPHVKAVTFKNQLHQTPVITVDNQIMVMGNQQVVDFEQEKKADFELSAGRIPEAANEIVISYHFRSGFENKSEVDSESKKAEGKPQGKRDNPTLPAKEWIGKTLNMEVKQRIDGKEQSKTFPLTIVGVAKKPTREWLKPIDLYMNIDMLKEVEAFTGTLFGAMHTEKESEEPSDLKPNTAPHEYDDVHVFVDSAQHAKEVGDNLKANNFMVYSVAEEIEQINVIFLVLKIGLIFVGTIAILIASIGIFNTMTMAVTERSQDIGIMKAIGAHPKTIKSVFLIESSYIGFMGALFGTIVAYIISFGVNAAMPLVIRSFMNEKMPEGFVLSHIPIYLTLICVAISLIVAIISGYRPAKKATKVDVLKALRRDV